jgi:hypothetical protein
MQARFHDVFSLAAAVVLAVIPAPLAGADSAKCDRACLVRALNLYLSAVLNHDPSFAPLDANFRCTENAMVMKPGEGIWKSAAGLGNVRFSYFDPVNESAVYFGDIKEGTGALRTTGIATLRIRVVDRKITEGELVIARPGNGILSVDGLTAHMPPKMVPLDYVAKRTGSTREGMVAAANSYFDGLQNHDGSHVLQQKGCVRVENGVTTAGHPADEPGAAVPAPVKGAPPVSEDCGSGMEVFKATIAAVDHRRFPVIDEEAGVVLGMAVFNRPPGAKRPDGTPFPRNLLTEIFAVENNRIRGIYAAMHYMFPDVPDAPGW